MQTDVETHLDVGEALDTTSPTRSPERHHDMCSSTSPTRRQYVARGYPPKCGIRQHHTASTEYYNTQRYALALCQNNGIKTNTERICISLQILTQLYFKQELVSQRLVLGLPSNVINAWKQK